MIEILEAQGSVAFTELFGGVYDKHYFIATFLALLELMKLNLVYTVQNQHNDVIRIFYQ